MSLLPLLGTIILFFVTA